jgi:hypothetical protein
VHVAVLLTVRDRASEPASRAPGSGCRRAAAVAEQKRTLTVVERNLGAVMTRSILVLATAFIFSGTAFAQSSGTPQEQAACRASVKRYCAQAIQGGDMMVLSCLQQNRPRISKACQRVLVKYGQ